MHFILVYIGHLSVIRLRIFVYLVMFWVMLI